MLINVGNDTEILLRPVFISAFLPVSSNTGQFAFWECVTDCIHTHVLISQILIFNFKIMNSAGLTTGGDDLTTGPFEGKKDLQSTDWLADSRPVAGLGSCLKADYGLFLDQKH